MNVLEAAQALHNVFDSNKNGMQDFYRKIVVGNLSYIKGLLDLADSYSKTDRKTRSVILELLIMIKKSIEYPSKQARLCSQLTKITQKIRRKNLYFEIFLFNLGLIKPVKRKKCNIKKLSIL